MSVLKLLWSLGVDHLRLVPPATLEEELQHGALKPDNRKLGKTVAHVAGVKRWESWLAMRAASLERQSVASGTSVE